MQTKDCSMLEHATNENAACNDTGTNCPRHGDSPSLRYQKNKVKELLAVLREIHDDTGVDRVAKAKIEKALVKYGPC